MDPLWTDQAQVWLLAGQLAVLAVAAFMALRQVREARRLREDQTRPFVVVDFEPIEVHGFLDLVVKNVGPTMARDVRIAFDPPIQSTRELDVPIAELKMLREGIPTLAPGKEHRMHFAFGPDHYKSDLPDSFRARVRYSDQRGRRWFDELMDLDLGLYWSQLRVDVYGLHYVHERLKEIRDLLKQMKA